MQRRCTLLALACASFAAMTGAAQAQDYPTRPVTVVVPFPAGGPSDVVARIVAEHMSRTLGQSMVIENVGGAGGTIGSGRVAAAAPDGYTLLGRQHGIACRRAGAHAQHQVRAGRFLGRSARPPIHPP